MPDDRSTSRCGAPKPRIKYADFMDMLKPHGLFVYGEDRDFSNGWIFHHWALCGSNARPAIWGL